MLKIVGIEGKQIAVIFHDTQISKEIMVVKILNYSKVGRSV